MAAASGSFGFGDKVAQALREAQDVLNQNPLSAAVHLQPSTSAVEASLDRTEKAAQEASAQMGGSGAPGSAAAPLVAQDKLIEVMQALVNAIVDDTKTKGGGGGESGGGGRAKGPPRPPGGPEDESKPGYMNPYALQSLMNNPLGFAQQSGYSMMSGGAGNGMKPPAWMADLLGGENGLNIGRALASPVGGGAPLGGGFLASGAAAALPPLALLAGAKVGWGIGQSISNTYDETAAGQLEDYKLSRRLGFDFREQAYTSNRMQSARDLSLQDDREILSAMDVGVGSNPSNNAYRAESVNKMMLNLGLSGSMGGSMIGAMIKGGAASNMDQGVVLLDKIAKGVEDAARAGWSTAEGMRTFSGLQAGTAGATGGVVTAEATMRNDALMDAFAASRSASLRGDNGVQAVAQLGQINNPQQRAFLMSSLLESGPGGVQRLSKTGQAAVNTLYDPARQAAMRKALGPMADVMMASGVLDDPNSSTVIKAMNMQSGDPFSSMYLGADTAVKAGNLSEISDIVKGNGFASALRRVKNDPSDAGGGQVGAAGHKELSYEATGAYASRVGKSVDTISGVTDDLAAGYRDAAKVMSLLATKTTRFGDVAFRSNMDALAHPIDAAKDPIRAATGGNVHP